MNVDLEVLRSYEKRGLLRCSYHPVFPLTIWNYTSKVEWDKLWDVTTRLCRGLVLDDAGKIIARPFPKFYNLEEHKRMSGSLPNGLFTATEKLDGSLIIVAKWEPYAFAVPQFIVASRGSFKSEQALIARKLFRERQLSTSILPVGITLCFEIIYPENRIVVDYGQREELILLAAFRNETGEELPIEDRWFKTLRVESTVNDFRDLPERPNAEGYVLRFENGVRVKLKNAEYVRLHRLLTGTTARRIWEAMRDGRVEEVTENAPEDFKFWVKATIMRINAEYQAILTNAVALLDSIDPALPRSAKAEKIKKAGSPISTIAFLLLDGRDCTDALWKAVKPKGEGRPFRCAA